MIPLHLSTSSSSVVRVYVLRFLNYESRKAARRWGPKRRLVRAHGARGATDCDAHR